MTFEMFLGIGTALLTLVVVLAGRSLHMPVWKRIVAGLGLTASGVFGARLMSYLEGGVWDGYSYFGAVFFPMLSMLLLALLLRVPYGEIMDVSAPGECVMLAILKVNCYVTGCCYGKLLYISKNGYPVRFPSQLVECGNGVLLMVILLLLVRRTKLRGRVYGIYLILYGVTRFALNLFRETEPFWLGLPAGNLWAIVSIVVGVVWIALSGLRGKRMAEAV